MESKKGNRLNSKMVKRFLEERGISKRRFCEICRISYSQLKKVLIGDLHFKLNVIFKIAKVLEVEVYQLFY